MSKTVLTGKILLPRYGEGCMWNVMEGGVPSVNPGFGV